MFVGFDRGVRVSLCVVGLGTPDRLRECLAALVAHESRHEFTVGCVINPAANGPVEPTWPIPGGVLVDHPEGNLGWAGGLHRARDLTDAELLVWVQEDMTPEPGWLDALVAAADTHPGVAAFGSVRVGEHGKVLTPNAGDASPPDDVAAWNATDRTVEHLPEEVATYAWVTSKGLLTRAVVFDEVGGPDPRLFPLNHVDKDYCTHVRCHGWQVALVPAARLRHQGSQASPSALREFLPSWRDGWFNDRWAGPLARLAGRPSSSSDPVAHPCAEWRERRVDPVQAAVGIEASRMLVPFARARARSEAAALAAQAAHHDEVVTMTQQHSEEAVRLFEEVNERARAMAAARHQQVRRARRLRRQRDAARAELLGAPQGRGSWPRERARALWRRVRGR